MPERGLGTARCWLWVPFPPLLAAALLAATAAYLNTLTAQFTFDDSFAVALNSPMSHKSYRPLTVLSFRLQRALGQSLFGARRARLLESWAREGRHDNSHGLDPFVFHATNVAAHAVVTALVYALALRLAAARGPRRHGATGATQPGAAAGAPGGAARRAHRRWPPSGQEAEAGVAALLFALHPVHTEAVAGVVGHAELLCAGLSIAALLRYMDAADGRARGWRAQAAALTAAAGLAWAAALAKEIGITIVGAMLCYEALLARPPMEPALAPPVPPNDPATAAMAGPGGSRGPVARASKRGGSAPAPPRPRHPALARRRWLAFAPSVPLPLCSALGRAARVVAMACTLLLYVWARSFLAGDQLVRIYRKVENPIPFAESSLVRKLTTGYLHARYTFLLLAPARLSADWSFACVDYVSSLPDPRNAATAALYAALAACVAAARPWELPRQWAAAPAPGEGSALRTARWRLAVLAGLVIAPFFPASNVLFYVGTFIGERLLYMPSVGACLLAAELLAAALTWQTAAHGAGANDGASASTGSSSGKPGPGAEEAAAAAAARRRRAARLRAAAAAVLLAALLAAFAVRTVTRNRDWADEEALFRAAERVCDRSAKVQLNMGILERRHQRWDAALAHFRAAQEIDPTYCEPNFHIGLTLVASQQPADPEVALEYLEKAVACKYVAADAVKAINQARKGDTQGWEGTHAGLVWRGWEPRLMAALAQPESTRANPELSAAVGSRWGRVLALPELQRYTEAAFYYEQGALALAKAGHADKARELIASLVAALQAAAPTLEGRTPDAPVRVAAARVQTDWLAACAQARLRVMLAIAAARGDCAAPRVKAVAYQYLRDDAGSCRRAVEVPDASGPEDAQARSQSFHPQLIHELQRADARDPWLQHEWGLSMLAARRVQEAAIHLEVAGHILFADLQAQLGGRPSGLRSLETGRALGAAEACDGAVAAYRAAEALAVEAVRQAAAAQGAPLDAHRRPDCLLRQHLCQAHLLGVEAAGPGSQERAKRERELTNCIQYLSIMGCSHAGQQPGVAHGAQQGPSTVSSAAFRAAAAAAWGRGSKGGAAAAAGARGDAGAAGAAADAVQAGNAADGDDQLDDSDWEDGPAAGSLSPPGCQELR
eukprot:scaffold3.g6721.t1